MVRGESNKAFRVSQKVKKSEGGGHLRLAAWQYTQKKIELHNFEEGNYILDRTQKRRTSCR